jgi:hypothetical protein
MSGKVYLLQLVGNGNGDGNGYGYGNGNGYGNGDGNGNGNGYGDGNGYGNGYGYGDGNGNGDGYGNGNGYGYGYGDGNGDGDGYGYGNGNGIYKIKMFGEWFECSGEIENSLCYNLPSQLHDKIDKAFISKVNNLESLRALREKIGLERYIQLLDAKMICEEVDNQGHKMKLYQYNEQEEKVIILEVVCPSTNRIYHLYPPNQKAKNCFEAKASTFRNKPIKIRHGDVALVEIGKVYNAPIHES